MAIVSTIQGPGGSITLSATSGAKLGSWSGTLIIPTVRTTGFVDVGNKTCEPVSVEFAGSAAGVAVANTVLVPAAGLGDTPNLSLFKGTVTLYGGGNGTGNSSGGNYSFLAVINGMPLNRPCDGRYDVMYTFENSGSITQS